jgi:hypothetical protein
MPTSATWMMHLESFYFILVESAVEKILRLIGD